MICPEGHVFHGRYCLICAQKAYLAQPAVKARMKEYYTQHADKLKARMKEYRAQPAARARRNEYMRKYQQSHRVKKITNNQLIRNNDNKFVKKQAKQHKKRDNTHPKTLNQRRLSNPVPVRVCLPLTFPKGLKYGVKEIYTHRVRRA